MGSKEKTTVPFNGTPEQEKALREMIGQHKGQQGALMPVLQQAQEIYGYLPIEVQSIIAEEMEIPLEKVYGVSTFYSQFSLYPKGKYKISVCLGTQDGIFSLDACRCIGACGLAPVMTVNDDVYGKLTVDQIDGILAKYTE